MAIVKDYIAPNGVRVRVDDDCYAGISAEELARRKREVSEAILAIDRAVQLREMAEREDREDKKGPASVAAPAGQRGED